MPYTEMEDIIQSPRDYDLDIQVQRMRGQIEYMTGEIDLLHSRNYALDREAETWKQRFVELALSLGREVSVTKKEENE